ncbi:MAG: CHAT domain-containing protein [Lewinellaceae bacterium]|nr:CHAT domain-containing protein [Lewinellaceae bacterium]
MYTSAFFTHTAQALLLLCLCPVFLPGQACDSLNALAEEHFSAQDRQAFFRTAREAKTACAEEVGEADAKYVQALGNWGVALGTNNRYREKLAVLEEALQLVQPYKESHPALYSEILNNLGVSYSSLGLYKKALALYQESLRVKSVKGINGTELSYAKTLWNLGNLYPKTGELEKALDCCEKAREIIEKARGKNDYHYSEALRRLAIFYSNAQLYEQALDYALASKENLWLTHEDNTPVRAGILHTIGMIYEGMEQYEKAVAHYEQVQQLAEGFYGKKHWLYAYYTNSLANGYKHLKQFDKALSFSREALEIIAQVFGEDNPRYGNHLNDLASIYHKQKQYSVADSLMQAALANNYSTFGPKHRQRRLVTKNYGILRDKQGDYPTAFQYYRESNAILHDEIERYFGIFNEAQREAFLSAVQEDFQIYQFFTYKARQAVPRAQAMIYDDALALKGLLLHNAENVLAAIRNNPDTSLARLYDAWIGQRELIAAQKSLPLAARAYSPIALDSLERAAGLLERQLADGSQAFRKARRKVDWTEVQQALSEAEAAIEFLAFPHLEAEDSVLYCALVLRPGFEFPKLVYLFEEKELSRRLSRELYPTQRYIHELYTPELYQLIWQPLEEALQGAQTVYYAPAGLLHRIALPALRVNSSALLTDHCRLENVSSTRMLAEEKPGPGRWASAMLFGGIFYDTLLLNIIPDENPLAASGIVPEEEEQSNRGWSEVEDPSRGACFDTLHHTRPEVMGIHRLLQSQGVRSSAFAEYSASEEQFKALGRHEASPAVLHLATHGYFFDDDRQRETPDSAATNARDLLSRSVNPLQRSGLALANANLAWEKGIFRPEREDGILTAYEIANLDLSGTRLAVLSACQTGLGDIRGSEGVYGLQRAFKMAGVDYLLLTLWNISDGQQTVEFMTSFYEKCLAGLPIRQAFREAQGEMRQKYGDAYFWAPFVLVE